MGKAAKKSLLPTSGTNGKKGKSGRDGVPLAERLKHPAYPSTLIFVMSLYFCVFVLGLLDVNVDDGSGLIKAYEEIRAKNLEMQKLEQERLIIAEKERIDSALQDYQGDTTAPWINPFAQTQVGKVKPKNAALESAELLTELEDSIFAYLAEHADALDESTRVKELVDEANPVREKLRKRQIFIEDRFDKVSEMEASRSRKDYTYNSVLSDPTWHDKLALPPTISDLAEGKGSIIASLGSFFGISKPSSSAAAASSSAGARDAGGRASDAEQLEQMRSAEAFASLAGARSGAPKTASTAALEASLSGIGYQRHRASAAGKGLPLWIVGYGRRCPSLKAVLAKDQNGESHTIFCAAYSDSSARHVLAATQLAQDRAAIRQSLGATDMAATFATLDKLMASSAGFPAHVFHRAFVPSDRDKLSSAPPAPAGYLVLQKNGASKPQAVKSVKALLANEKYQETELGIVVTPMPPTSALWTGSRAFMLRSWLVILQGSPMIAYSAMGDAVVGAAPFQQFSGKEAPDDTARVRFPTFAIANDADGPPEGVEIHPATDLASVLGVSDTEIALKLLAPVRRIATYVAWAHSSRAMAQPVSDKVHLVEHLCLDFTIEADLAPKLVTISSECSLAATSPSTRASITNQVIVAAEHLLLEGEAHASGAGLDLVLDQASGYMFTGA